MTRAVEDALAVLSGGRRFPADEQLPRGIVFCADQADALDEARTTLAAHIAAQDAEIARLREALKPLAMLDLVPGGFDKYLDDQPVYARDNSTITVGDVRRATAALEAK